MVPFWGSYLESHKVIPKRSYYGAYGYSPDPESRALQAAQTSESEQTHGENLPAPNVLKPRALVEPQTTPKSNALLHVVGSLGTSCREALLAWCEL